ncbi:uncharacterized protein N7529_001585 [Penicillium soppii]|uniref:uncharacterized protein n=1 Tax=Penicillium soppii TaxID=69789 RepID=UPI002548C2B8|nr:uncharacterized protein N7529_001585 [Penicillium soppii]KAJ5876001.1 hypothetical protein N7529_001585 [Penicillium soppii]
MSSLDLVSYKTEARHLMHIHALEGFAHFSIHRAFEGVQRKDSLGGIYKINLLGYALEQRRWGIV